MRGKGPGEPAGKKQTGPKKGAKPSPETAPLTNDTLTDDQKRGLYLNGLQKLERLKSAAADIAGKIKQVRKEMKADGYDRVEVDYGLWLRREDTDDEAVAEQRAARERVAKWLARPEGFQGGLFDGPGDGVDRTPAVERAYEAGKTAGLDGKTASPPHDASTPQGQAWLRGHADGQAVLTSGFKPLPANGEKGFKDDAEAANPSMRARGNPAKGMPGAKKDGEPVH